MAGQLPEGQTVEGCTGVAACVGERQACFHSGGRSGAMRPCICQYLPVFMRCVSRAKHLKMSTPLLHPPSYAACYNVRDEEHMRPGENVLLLFQSLKHLLKPITLENLITHRSLLHEGKLVLTGVESLRQTKVDSSVLSAFSLCLLFRVNTRKR